MAVKYVCDRGATLKTSNGNYELLWGDPCHVVAAGPNTTTVKARDRQGTVESSRLIEDPGLLEFYVIDVGQGDGVLMKTPDGKWHLIDGGHQASKQMTMTSAASFTRWKFQKDLLRPKIALETIILTHPDADHYGGLIDVMKGQLPKPGESDVWNFEVSVGRFFHPGLGRYKGGAALGATASGTTDPLPFGQHGFDREDDFFTELLNGKGDFGTPPRELSTGFRDLAALVATVPGTVRALSHRDAHLPGYGPGGAGASIRVLGPVLESFGAQKGLRKLGGDSISTNGHSVVLRVDYGNARILLTGDLNTKSQALLLAHHDRSEFQVDVAKGCHHGSDDIDLDFVAAMGARATVISSGDNEDYSHPRPRVMGASARLGRDGVDLEGAFTPPLLYSTELSRSVKLGYVERARRRTGDQTEKLDLTGVEVTDKATGTTGFRRLAKTPVSFGLVYGLVNVRTDGRRILFATLEEKGHDFDKRWLVAGVGPV